MTLLLTTAVLGTAALTAVRSTWSPCGRSMLSTITPLGERGRGTRYGSSVAWFVTGAVLGGASLGLVMAAAATALSAAGTLPVVALAATVAAAAGVAAASDTRLAGLHLPFHRRQVNELWLDRFRPWVYGAGFGWQIGSGFATYVTSAGLYLMVLLAALRASPVAAFATGVAFGLVRGLAVLLGRRITSPEALVGFHRRFDVAERSVHAVVVSWELALCAAAVGLLWLPGAGVVALLSLAGSAGRGPLRRALDRRSRRYARPSALQAGSTSAGVA